MRTLPAVLLLLHLGLTPGPTSTAPRAARNALFVPLTWLASPVLALFKGPQPLPNSVALSRERGWSDVTLDVDNHGTALYLQLSGRFEFGRAVIEYGDGERDQLDLRQASRNSGIYELKTFDRDRDMHRVTLELKALSPTGYVGARLMR